MAENVTSLSVPQKDRTDSSPDSPAEDSPSEEGAPIASHDFEIEQGLLGALMVNNGLYDHIQDFLQPGHFYDPLHSKIFELIGRLILNDEPATAITLRAYFDNDERMEKKGGVAYLARLEGSAGSFVNSLAWARSIQSYAQRRHLMSLGQDIYHSALTYDIDNPPDKQIEHAEAALYMIAEHGLYQKGMQSFDASLAGALEMAEQAHQLSTRGGLPGLSTGFRDLDEKLGALRSSDLIILAGRPAMGKTGLATNIAFNIARSYQMSRAAATGSEGEDNVVDNQGGVVGFFSLEMSAEQLSMRILADRANIPAHYIRQGDIRDDDLKRLHAASRELSSLPLYIDHTGAISLQTLVARARRLKRQKNLGMIVVDYLQLVTTHQTNRSYGRVQEVSEVTQGLKAMAKDLDIPVLALSQLSRQVESREDNRPQLSDLRESGAIEQDADIVLFLFREEYYLHYKKPPEDREEEFAKWQQKMEQVQGRAEVIIGKHRHGPTGVVELHFDRSYTRFSDYAPPEMTPEYRG